MRYPQLRTTRQLFSILLLSLLPTFRGATCFRDQYPIFLGAPDTETEYTCLETIDGGLLVGGKTNGVDVIASDPTTAFWVYISDIDSPHGYQWEKEYFSVDPANDIIAPVACGLIMRAGQRYALGVSEDFTGFSFADILDGSHVASYGIAISSNIVTTS